MSWTILDWVAALLQTTPEAMLYACGTTDAFAIVGMVLSDAFTFGSYMVIGGFFISFVVKAKVIGWTPHRTALEVSKLFDVTLLVLTGLFVVSCGVGHLVDVLADSNNLSRRVEMYFHAATALISVCSAGYLLWRGKHGQ